MSALVIKNLPDHLHVQLKLQAQRNHRSLTKEAIQILEAGLSQGAIKRQLPPLIKLRGDTAPPLTRLKPRLRTDRNNHVVLVDTNILFALLIESDWTKSARDLHAHDGDWRTETHALVELSNALTRYVRVRKLAVAQATTMIQEAQALIGTGLYEVRHTDALELAVDCGVSAYDARFLCAARLLGARLVTEDVKLRKAAPNLTCSLADALVA